MLRSILFCWLLLCFDQASTLDSLAANSSDSKSDSFELGFLDKIFTPKKRSHLQIVGSSTVYPFSAVIAETFGRETKYKTPIVEATGTGGGFKLFCSGIGYEFPDFVNASRRIKESEKRKCRERSVNAEEIKIGYDGIVLANAISGTKYQLTKTQIFLALARLVPNGRGELVENFYKNWSDIDQGLPSAKIAVYGPPSTSGTRDAFVELIMQDVCKNDKIFIKHFPNQESRIKRCQLIRGDGAFIEAGENDNLIVQKLKNDRDALGIFGYSFLQENQNLIQGVELNGVIPTYKNIASGRYSASRPLFIYYKKEHLGLIDGMREFIAEITSPNTLGKDGYLLQNGLIALSDHEIEKLRDKL